MEWTDPLENQSRIVDDQKKKIFAPPRVSLLSVSMDEREGTSGQPVRAAWMNTPAHDKWQIEYVVEIMSNSAESKLFLKTCWVKVHDQSHGQLYL